MILQPKEVENDVLIQFSPSCLLERSGESVSLTVPAQYQAIVFVDETPIARHDSCMNEEIIRFIGKEYYGHHVKVAFILTKNLTKMQWGFGNINVNNERLQEAYRVGANGEFSINIDSYRKLIGQFSTNENITVEQIREKTLSAIKAIGVPLLSKFFANTDVSVFEVNSLMLDFQKSFVRELNKSDVLKLFGLSISSLTCNGIHVNEEDMESIRSRLNG